MCGRAIEFPRWEIEEEVANRGIDEVENTRLVVRDRNGWSADGDQCEEVEDRGVAIFEERHRERSASLCGLNDNSFARWGSDTRRLPAPRHQAQECAFRRHAVYSSAGKRHLC